MIYVVGALGSAFSQTATELIVARFVLGIAVGTASFVSPMYISELAPKRIRGGVTSFNQLMVVCGIFVAYIVNWALKGAADNWRWMLGLGAIPGAAFAVGMFFQPFSPRWLIQQGRDDEARDVLHRARDDEDDVEGEIEEIKEAAGKEGCARCGGPQCGRWSPWAWLLRDRPGARLLADDLRDLPAARPQPGDEPIHGRQLDGQLHRLLVLPLAHHGHQPRGRVLGLCRVRRRRPDLLHRSRARDQGPDAGADRAGAHNLRVAPLRGKCPAGGVARRARDYGRGSCW
jgi:hypothetical protein